ncbi:aa3-type cytochrome c oxidase subunit IV [Stappia sp.]|uniref:aa3-type cytochrome c oxidase subunit IV n=1 Tax=Stappia sp. TaxID=1870903 RepID=UPI0032D965E2
MSDQSLPSMDYAEHERTYAGFINVSKIGIVAAINVMLCLILFAFGGGAGGFFGAVLLFLTILVGGIGLFMGERGWIPSTGVTVLAGLVAILTAT